MKASVVDLRYNMKDILKALDRNEKVTILYHGKIKGTIMPNTNPKIKKVKTHPFFSMLKDEKTSVVDKIQGLRGARYNDL